MRRDRIRSVRLTTAEAAELDRRAAAEGVSVSELLRENALQSAPPAAAPSLPRVVFTMARCEHLSIGNAWKASCGICGPMAIVYQLVA